MGPILCDYLRRVPFPSLAPSPQGCRFTFLMSPESFLLRHSLFFFLIKFILLIYWLCQVFVAVRGLRRGVRASHCGGFSCCRAWALGVRASAVVAHGLSSCGTQAPERRLSSCGARA